ncbi:MAG: glycosyltransferase family 2 protein, partial [Methyloligellaceae bacterium]
MRDVDISVIVGSMNRGDWVASLESVLNQDYPSYEVVLAVDTLEPDRDGIERLRQKYDHLKVIFNERSLGPAGARNVAAHAASGRVLAVHDDDDYAVPHRLSRIMAYMAANDVDLVCSYAHWRFVYSDRTMVKRMPLTDAGLKA